MLTLSVLSITTVKTEPTNPLQPLAYGAPALVVMGHATCGSHSSGTALPGRLVATNAVT